MLEAWIALRRRHPVSTANALRQLAAAARFRLPARRPPLPMLVLGGRRDALVDPHCSRALAAHWQLAYASIPAPATTCRWTTAPGWPPASANGWTRTLSCNTPRSKLPGHRRVCTPATDQSSPFATVAREGATATRDTAP